MDNTTKELLQKALTGSDISGKLVQEVIDKIVSFVFLSENPFRQNIPVVKGNGSAYIFNRRTASSTPGQAIADTDSFTEATGSYTQIRLPYVIYGTSIEVTRYAQAIGRNYIDILQEELKDRLIEFREWEQKALLWGNYVSDFTSGTKYADGFIKQIVDNGNGNYILLGSDNSGGNLTLAKLDEAIDKCYQMPNMIICSRTGRRILQGLLQAQQRFVNMTEIKGGFKVMEYMGIPVLTSTAIPDTIQYQYNGGGTGHHDYVSALTGGATTIFLVMNFGDSFIAELESLATKEVPVTTAQKTKYEIWEYITPVVKNPKNHCVIFGIKTA